MKLAALAELHSHFSVHFPSPCVLVSMAKLCFLLQLATVESTIKREVKMTDFLKCVTAELVSQTKTEAVLLTKMKQTHR